ncbi:MAG: hypothetical protein A2Y76_12010 [Planctomycetes bacterium RBG_13_60_9]|nr:MAG: hypothetical protein A2Y76_12010 [Planctomycetes bacterium RBG_13_60_9]
MAKRLSNRERIERMAEEASIKAEEKEPKTDVRKAPRSRKTSPIRKRMKFIWKIVDANAKEIASFPYQGESQAQARAAELSQKTGKPHTVNRVRVPMADDE